MNKTNKKRWKKINKLKRKLAKEYFDFMIKEGYVYRYHEVEENNDGKSVIRLTLIET